MYLFQLSKKVLFFTFSFLYIHASFAQKNPLEVKKYVLDNGFTILLNPDENAKEVYGAVVVKAGSKNDPADATGMAHYLEHLLFKGTTELGTTSYDKEKPFLDSINYYYDLLAKTKDIAERNKIQLLINNQSVQASQYGLPTEFDKLVKSIGGVGLNAFTSNDMTVYHNSFPGEQMEKWLDLYSHRFQHPVFRSFQSELEVVYEEKNRGMDNFTMKIIEEMNKNLFKYHPYGTQSTIGTVEHLKNPSLTKMYQYFNDYYVANNMALVLSGNFDIEQTLPLIKEKFSQLRSGRVAEFPKYPVSAFNRKEVKKVRWSPIKVGIIGFKTIPNVHPDKAALSVLSSLLFNESETGRFNKLQQQRKIMLAASMDYSFNDDGALMLIIVPKLVGQSFKAVEKLVFNEIKKIQQGDISDEELKIIKTELYRIHQLNLESYKDRTFNIVNTFSQGIDWNEYLKFTALIDAVTKEDVVNMAKKYLTDNYFAIYSKTGFPKKDKIEKPGFKPVVTDQKEESAFAAKFNQKNISINSPRFLDLKHDAQQKQITPGTKLYYVKNPINDIFSLKVIYQVGYDSLKSLDLTASLFNYFYTSSNNVDKIKEQFALNGITYSADCDKNRFTITFEGLERNLEKALPIINELIQKPVVDNQSVKIIVDEILTGRKEADSSPSSMNDVMFDYIRFGKNSEYLTQLSSQELKKLKANELLNIYHQATACNTIIHYTGTKSLEELSTLLSSSALVHAENSASYPIQEKNNNTFSENTIFILHDAKAIQSQINFIVNSNDYQNNAFYNAQIKAFNQYMGGSFSGLILQEIREFRSLAYSASGRFVTPLRNEGKTWFKAYIGCQADKTNEAIETMNTLITQMPEKPERVNSIKSMLNNSVSAFYPDLRDISAKIDLLQQCGYQSNPLQEEYKQYNALTFEDVVSFYKNNILHKPIVISIYGNTSKFDLKKLEQFGKIVTLEKDDIRVY